MKKQNKMNRVGGMRYIVTFWNSIKSFFGYKKDPLQFYTKLETPIERDTNLAIQALNLVVRNDPSSVETFLALGNLYRAKGDIERAIKIRNSLLVRPNLNDIQRGKVYYELGLDYKRGGFIDRSLMAFSNATKNQIDIKDIDQEVAILYADSSNFEKTADIYAKLGNVVAESYYLTQLAKEFIKNKETDSAKKILKKAVKVYVGSIDAWFNLIILSCQIENWRKVNKIIKSAFNNIPLEKHFFLLDALYIFIQETEANCCQFNSKEKLEQKENEKEQNDIKQIESNEQVQNNKVAVKDNQNNYEQSINKQDNQKIKKCNGWKENLCSTIINNSDGNSLNLLKNYYLGIIALHCNKKIEGIQYFEKSLITEPEFWAARLELLVLSLEDERFNPVLQEQIEYFIQQGRQTRKFICKVCGLRRRESFYLCPKCHSWYSANFRIFLKD